MDVFAKLQYLLPKRLITRSVGLLGRSTNHSVKNLLIRTWIDHFKVDLNESARKDPSEYENFVDFFTRELDPAHRNISDKPTDIVSPVDGTVSQSGLIENGLLIQAKGRPYTVNRLLGSSERWLEKAQFATIYLSPRDYHRVHSPVSGLLIETTEIPGELFSVNAASERSIKNLFCTNERLVFWFSTPRGPVVLVMVGAMIVAGIETVWAGPKTPYRNLLKRSADRIPFQKGDEVAQFTLGSTVILIVPNRVGSLIDFEAGHTVRMGEPIGNMRES